ncbi:VWA domain-containing protein [Luteimonas sp. Y-2-2-4F]|nr:VWA domain-containing protein [Luteimonas sp. Y-2-2-4F]MCD9031263.1 VWA domain-containing protein [Luteimonas sp. Y-2-2-4F]
MPPPSNTERYAQIDTHPVRRVSEAPVSTFSVDVDTGSYSNVRRMLRQGRRPPADAVRTEEFVNYFRYGHPGPDSAQTPFRVTTELAPSPWGAGRQLLMIGIRGYDVAPDALPPANLVFLIDTSGSMQGPDKLPLLQQSLATLVERLRPQDRVSLVTYAGSAGLALPPTAGDRKAEILAALHGLRAGGGTHGSAGLALAYATARQAHVAGGINRVILATDGDFNVGIVDRGELETYVADQRRGGIALSTLGFGQGNYHDAMAERLADVGDGQHAYIDTLQEARKVLVEALSSTLLTIARDVKVQVEFDPARVAEYRLIGYENRALDEADFANDRVDAGDIGAGHEVTALYEIALAGGGGERLPPRRYGTPAAAPTAPAAAGEIAHVAVRYKRPGESRSRLIATPVRAEALRARPSDTLRFAAGVAAYADALRGGAHLGDWGWEDIRAALAAGRGDDPWGLRGELLGLVDLARSAVEPARLSGSAQANGADGSGRP